MRFALPVVAAMSTASHAGTTPPDPTAAPEQTRIGIGASLFRPPSVGASVFAGVSRRHALHLKAARYRPFASLDAEADRIGRIWEIGASWIVYVNRVLEGVSLEAGLFVRDTDLAWSDEPDDRTRSESIGARVFVGWSHTLKPGLFLTVALGASKWIESGTESTRMTHKPFIETPLELDGYVRIGFAFDGCD